MKLFVDFLKLEIPRRSFSESPDHRDHPDGDRPAEQVERKSDPHEVGIPIPAWPVDDEVGGVPERGGERAARGHGDCDDEGAGVDAERRDPTGNINAAAAL
jgi:hypothetical protein